MCDKKLYFYPVTRSFPRLALLCVLFLALGSGHALAAAQGALTIRGVVVDTNEPPQPLAGATVIVQGTTVGTITDESGFFSIKADKGDTLIISFMGYVTNEYRVNGSVANASIALAEDVTTLEQVIVTGMTGQARNKVASSVGVIKQATFTNKPITRLSQALQGGTTGIFVSQESGLPGGDGAKIKIRGVASLLGSDPLILIDGFESDMEKLDPATVESISVLKDASAAAMYGAKSGNGVIVITTKRGAAGKVSVGYNGYYGVQQPLYLPEFVDAGTYMEYHNVASVNSNSAPIYSETMIQTTRDGSDPINFPDTDWQKEAMLRFTNIHEHSLSVSGGNTTARFALSAQYMKQEGIYKYMENGFERMAIRLNTTINLTKTLFTYVDAFINREVQSMPKTQNWSMLDYIYRTPPTVAGIYPQKEGSNYTYYGIFQQMWNPLLNLQRGWREEKFRDYATINVRPVWHITPELVLKGQFGYRLSSGLNRWVRKPSYDIKDYFTDESVYTFNFNVDSSYPSRSSFWMASLMLDYNKKWASGHELNAYGGWSQEKDMRGTWAKVGLVSFFGKVHYSYKDRYLLEVGMRGDGSSLFGKGHKWAAFPSAAIGWNIKNENFMTNSRFINAMKLRLSYGMLGNNRLAPYKYQSTVNTSGTETVNGNPDITWEKVTIWNAGLDMSVWNNRIDFTAEAFRKITNGLIAEVPSTPSSGLLWSFINAGQARVNGFEVSVAFNHNFNPDTRISLNLGYSYSKSKLLSVNNDQIVGRDDKAAEKNKIYKKGYAIQEYYGYVANGLLSQDDLDNYYPIIGGYGASTLAQSPGDIRYVDMNGDGEISDADKVPLGAVDPSSVYHASLSFSWKNLDFETQINGVGAVPVFYTGLISNPINSSEGGKPQKWHMNYWTEDNTNARMPRPTLSAGTNAYFSTYWRENGAFVRVRFIQLGYTIPWISRKLHGETFRIYANVQNPFTFTKVQLIDPESKGEHTTYPMFRTYSVGLNIKF